MDDVANPFAFGAGNQPAALTGRDAEIEQFRVLLGRLQKGRSAQSMIVSGLRGVGKTVLLREFERLAISLGWVAPEPIEITSDTNFREEVAGQAHRVLIELSARHAVMDRLKRVGRFLQGFRVGATPEGWELSFDPDKVGAETSGDLERDLGQLFADLGEIAASADTGVVFLVDEMQFLKKSELEAIAAAMHRVSQRQLPIGLVATGLPQLPGQMVEAKSYAERLFAYPRLDKLSMSAAEDALLIPARDEGADIDPDAVVRLIEVSDRYPAFIQAYGEEAWRAADRSPITLEDVTAAEPIVLERLDREFFHVRFEKATPKEREYMAAMGDLGEGPYQSSAVAARAGFKSPNAAAPHRDTLIKKGLIYSPQHGYVAFSVPHFAGFMRRRYPLETSSSA